METIPFRKGMTEKELRESTKTDSDNAYEICSFCGEFWTGPKGITDEAKIVKVCSCCWEEQNAHPQDEQSDQPILTEDRVREIVREELNKYPRKPA